MLMLIEDKTVSGTGSFVALSFAYYYYASRLDFISILTFYFSPRHSENISCLVIVTFSFVPLPCTCLLWKYVYIYIYTYSRYSILFKKFQFFMKKKLLFWPNLRCLAIILKGCHYCELTVKIINNLLILSKTTLNNL